MGELFPSKATGQVVGHSRYASMPNAAKLKMTTLFGLPLVSTLNQQTLSDEAIDAQIAASVSWLEHTLDLYISPVDFLERHDWNHQHWTSNFGMLKLSHSNVIKVNFVKFMFSNDPDLATNLPFQIPNEMIYFEPKDGMIRITPVNYTTFTGWFYSMFGGYALSIMQAKGRIPGLIWVNYTTGFELDKLPALIADLISINASIELLSMLSTILFPYNSHSVSQDGLSHSSGTAGVQFLSTRIGQLQQRQEALLDSARRYYTKNLLMDWL